MTGATSPKFLAAQMACAKIVVTRPNLVGRIASVPCWVPRSELAKELRKAWMIELEKAPDSALLVPVMVSLAHATVSVVPDSVSVAPGKALASQCRT